MTDYPFIPKPHQVSFKLHLSFINL